MIQESIIHNINTFTKQININRIGVNKMVR
jgi:hypothetical protein